MTQNFPGRRNTLAAAAAFAAAALALAWSVPASAQAPIVIKFSHVVAKDTPKGKASEHFAERAAALTGGKVKVEVYANSTLYKDKEEMEALQTGVVDGSENTHSNVYTQKVHEVQKHMSITDHGYIGYAVITNKKFWDGLPADVRGQLEKAMTEATAYANKIAQEENDTALEKIRASGKTQVYVPTPAERLALKKAMLKVHKEMESRIGKDVIDTVYKATGFDPSKL